MKINLKFAKALQALTRGEEVNEGDFGGSASKELLSQLRDTGVIDYRPVGTQRKKYYCLDKMKLAAHLHHRFTIPSLDNYVDFLEQEDAQRRDAVYAASDSKFRNGKVMEGFLMHTYDNAEGELHGNKLPLHPLSGSFVFVHDFRHFKLPADVTVVGVENYDNFRHIERQRYLFAGIKPVFVWRYQNSNSIAEWLNLIPNSYLHYGDFDPEGLKIYVTQFRNKLQEGRCGFLIPADIESLIYRNGSTALFEKQSITIKQSDFNGYPEIKELASTIWRLKKGLEQEILINK